MSMLLVKILNKTCKNSYIAKQNWKITDLKSQKINLLIKKVKLILCHKEGLNPIYCISAHSNIIGIHKKYMKQLYIQNLVKSVNSFPT